MTTVPSVRLNNGVEIPQLGYGVFKIEPREAVEAITTALQVGYRHIDTAESYGNEVQVGEAVAESGVHRSEIFITSKLKNIVGYAAALACFDQTLADLGTDYVDLFLIHWPLATVRDFVPTWQAFERIYSEKRARAIGVSNFHRHHLERLLAETDIVPAVNQIECHPYVTQEPLLAFDAEQEIVTEAWAPIAKGQVLSDPVVEAVAERYNKTPSQVTLRWHVQRGTVVIPKSANPGRMKENFDIFDFELSDADMGRLSGLDRGYRTGPDPDVQARVVS